MPMPKPKPGESKNDFISRFMENPAMVEEYPDEKQRRAVADTKFKEMEMDEEKPEKEEKPDEKKKLFSLDEVEIFEAGKWNGDSYSEQDLDDMVAAFMETKGLLKPYLKLGHAPNQTLLQKDGLPAAGWITELKRKGKKLLAKIENMPEKIYTLIKNRAYGRVSSEIFWNLKLNGKQHRRALKAVALLGANTPEVTSLDDFIALYTTENYDAELKTYHILKEKQMDNDNKDLEIKLKEYELKLEQLSKENNELKEYANKVEYEKNVSEIVNYLEGQVEQGKITPAQVDYFTMLALDSEVKTYTNKENRKIEGKSFDIIKSIIENSSPIVDLGEKSKQSDVSEKLYSQEEDLDEHDKLDIKIKEYMKEYKVSYDEAFDVVSNGGN